MCVRDLINVNHTGNDLAAARLPHCRFVFFFSELIKGLTLYFLSNLFIFGCDSSSLLAWIFL